MSHVLTTERLVLRPVTTGDHAVLLAHWTAPDVREFLFDGEALSPSAVSQVIEDSGRDFATAGYGLWLVFEKGREAAGAVIEYALEVLGLPEVLAEIDAGNRASAAVIARLGMRPFDVVPGVLGPMTRYRRTR